jgi:Zn-dependent peptidase ImmA (M78 family)
MMIPRTRANALLRENKLSDLRGVDIEDIVSVKEIFFEATDLKGCQASILSSQNYSKITVNSNLLNSAQRRFAVAHELGHFILHRGIKKYYSDDERSFYKYHQDGSHEVEANEFASELLMPVRRFKDYSMNKSFDVDLIMDIATYFETSITSTSIKYSTFGHEPVATIFTQDGVIKWSNIHEQFPFSFIRPKSPVPAFSTVNEYYKSKIRHNSRVVIDAFIWFYEDFKIDKYPQSKLYEQVFYIDSINSAIVYLWVKKLG